MSPLNRPNRYLKTMSCMRARRDDISATQSIVFHLNLGPVQSSETVPEIKGYTNTIPLNGTELKSREITDRITALVNTRLVRDKSSLCSPFSEMNLRQDVPIVGRPGGAGRYGQ